jgi:hypothetical protein
MGRAVEILLFLLPFAVVAGLVVLRRAGSRPPRAAVIGLWIGIAVLASSLGLLVREGARPHERYVPAALRDGRIVAGHAQ